MQGDPTGADAIDHDAARFPRLLVSESGYGHLGITCAERCSRVPVERTITLRGTLAAALTRCGVPERGRWRGFVPVVGEPDQCVSMALPLLPDHLSVRCHPDGSVTLGDWTVTPWDAIGLRQALSLALAWCDAQPRPSYERCRRVGA